MQCTTCKAEIPSDAEICPRCGNSNLLLHRWQLSIVFGFILGLVVSEKFVGFMGGLMVGVALACVTGTVEWLRQRRRQAAKSKLETPPAEE